MRKFKRLTMTLALLIMAVSGAWAQSTLGVKEFEVPADWENNANYVTAGDLTGFKAATLAEAQAWTGAPAEGEAILVYAFAGNDVCFVQFSNGEPSEGKQSSWSKGFIFSIKSLMKFYYTTEITEWPLTSQDGKVWTLAKMPANDVELEVEYYAESNLYLSEDALKDKASIAVTAGELGVQFGEDGKSANTITEGTAMTVKYNGTKKVIGVKVEKKAAAKPVTLATALEDGAIIKVYFKWRNKVNGDYVQGVYNAASGTFTASKGGDKWGTDGRAVYKVEKSGDNIIIGAGFSEYNNEAMVWTFNTTNDTYTTTNGVEVKQFPTEYGLISVSVNGTDITSTLSELK